VTLAGIAAKNILRNKARTGLTILGTAIAILTFILIRTCVWAFSSGSDNAARDRVVTRNKVTFIMPLPKRYMDEVKKTPGVKQATFANWFGGKDPKHETEFFGTFAVDENYFDVVNEMSVPAADFDAWKNDKQGAIVGDVLAKKLNLAVGDKITLESSIYPAPDGQPWTFTIRGIYTATAKSIDRASFVFHWTYMNDGLPESRKDEIGWIMSRVTEGSSAADVGVAIDKRLENEDIVTLSQDERAFNKSFLAGISAVLSALDIVCLVILVIMLLILGNTIAMGVRERTQEYGVLRAIGFRPWHLTVFIVGEALLTAGLGGALGVAISYPIVEKGMGRFIEENLGNIIPYFRIPAADAGAAFALSLLLGLLAAALPAWGASRLKVTEALRRVA
jgi:putative ABC transport system permease protein